MALKKEHYDPFDFGLGLGLGGQDFGLGLKTYTIIIQIIQVLYLSTACLVVYFYRVLIMNGNTIEWQVQF